MNIIFNYVESQDYDDDCLICLNKINNKETAIECIKCKKQFHINCIKKWISHKEICPNCRYKVVDDEIINIDIELINSVIIYNDIYETNLIFHEITMGYMFVFFILKFLFILLLLLIIFLVICHIKF
tara:strand:- start:154 stop:534 length:381 start_codon:yes stop_codon:yes gene_type:complete